MESATNTVADVDPWYDDAPGTLARVADYLDVSTKTVTRWITDHGLPVHRVGTGPRATMRFYRVEVDAWLRNRCSDHDVTRSAS